jgi:membrane protein DedA with SNARE-associated domain
MQHFFTFFYHLFQSLGLFGAFLSMVIENLGIPLPTEIGYLVAREIVSLGLHSYIVVLLVLTLGHLTGSVISYEFGILSDNLIIKKLPHSNKIQKVNEKLKGWYKEYGTMTVFLTRFVGYVRPWSSFVAGLARVKRGPFLFWTALGSLIFNILCLYFTQVILTIWRNNIQLHFYIAATIFLCFFGFIIYAIFARIFSGKKIEDKNRD